MTFGNCGPNNIISGSSTIYDYSAAPSN